MEHALSAYHPKLEHGAGLIMVSLAYYTFLAKSGACNDKLITMAKALGRTEAKDPMDFVAALAELQKQCGVYGLKMSEYGITQEELPQIAQNARETMGGLFAAEPCEISNTDVVEILKQSYQ